MSTIQVFNGRGIPIAAVDILTPIGTIGVSGNLHSKFGWPVDKNQHLQEFLIVINGSNVVVVRPVAAGLEMNPIQADAGQVTTATSSRNSPSLVEADNVIDLWILLKGSGNRCMVNFLYKFEIMLDVVNKLGTIVKKTNGLLHAAPYMPVAGIDNYMNMANVFEFAIQIVDVLL